MIHATASMNLDIIIVSEISQKQKDKYMILQISRIGKFIQAESRGYHGLGVRRKWGVIA